MKILENYSLKKHNGFKTDTVAKYFVEIEKEADIYELLNSDLFKKEAKYFILGGGYNTLFATDYYDGLIIKISIKGIEKIKETSEEIYIKVGAGEDWHNFVKYTVENKLSGIENLALIPGQVGSAPVQNIAAYGQTQEDTFFELEAINITTGEKEKFSKEDCDFKYRTSIFKNKLAGQYIVVNVIYKLNKNTNNQSTSYWSRYESFLNFLEKKDKYEPLDIFNATIKIRNKKLPKVEEYGTLGSIFMNPFVTKKELKKIQKKFPGIQYYPTDKMHYPDNEGVWEKESEILKIPIGWILEELGWKNKQKGDVGTFKNHSLIVVTEKEGVSGEKILNFITEMCNDVEKQTNLKIKPEIIIVK